jgi:anti-sigma factor RsiW
MKELDVGGMRCSQVLALLSEYVDGELDAAAVDKIEKHLVGCPNCERFGRNFGAMVISLRQDSEKDPESHTGVVRSLLHYLQKESAES